MQPSFLQNFKKENRPYRLEKVPEIVLMMAGVLLVNFVLPTPDFNISKMGERNKKNELIKQMRQEFKEVIRTELKNYTGENPPSFALTDVELDSYVAGALESGGVAGHSSSRMSYPEGRASAMVLPPEPANVQRDRGIQRTLVQEGGMLLPKGKLQIEPAFTTAHFSSNRINIEGFSILPALVIGYIATESVKRDILFGSMSLKYGLWHNLQVEAKTPYRYEFDRVVSNLGEESTFDTRGIGDIETGLSYQIVHGKRWLPDTVVSMALKAPTGGDPYKNKIGLGTGHWGARSSLVLVKSSDPAAVFAVANYTLNLERTISSGAVVDPGDTLSYGLGTAIALSYQTAINFQLEHSVTPKTTWDGFPINGTFVNAASFKTGFTWTISEKMGVDVGLSVGLTTDAPDYVIEFRLPYTF